MADPSVLPLLIVLGIVRVRCEVVERVVVSLRGGGVTRPPLVSLISLAAAMFPSGSSAAVWFEVVSHSSIDSASPSAGAPGAARGGARPYGKGRSSPGGTGTGA